MKNNDKLLDMTLREYINQYSLSNYKINQLTGVPQFDILIGGFNPGIHFFEGPTSSGRTLLMLSIISEVQKRNGIPLFVDTTNKYRQFVANKFNIDPELLLLTNASAENQITNILEEGVIDVIVIDTLSAFKKPSSLLEKISYISTRSSKPLFVFVTNDMYMDISTKSLRAYHYKLTRAFASTITKMIRQSTNSLGYIIRCEHKDMFSLQKSKFLIVERDIGFPYADNIIMTATQKGVIARVGKYIKGISMSSYEYEEVVNNKILLRKIENMCKEHQQ